MSAEGTFQRNPLSSPKPGDPQYNRFKYYSALKTGYKQTNPKESGFLTVPKHVIENDYYVLPNPLTSTEPGAKQKSITTIFTCWNTMIGSGIVSLPWTINNSGILLGIIICIIGVAISYRTCILIIRTAGNDNEWFDTLYKYWGPAGRNTGLVSTALIMIAAVCAYFIIMT